MFRHTRSINAENRLEYRSSWINKDNHVWITFEVHRRIMQDRVMEFYVEVRQVGGSSGFCPFALMVPALINVATPDDVAMGITTLGMILTMRKRYHVIERRKTRRSQTLPLLEVLD
ncbi:hypothetical protein PIB30_026094 [Stylosanthes scabra]|uniref:Uncharacterized protein n=1 Tax=Stylosanthes scabra TaxID=79078 RepID=A0ABU6SA67_9FABA|nr:hypothetical protein [Stylosanthes scabra]